jgi:hypothetical protein
VNLARIDRADLNISGFTLARCGIVCPNRSTFEQWKSLGEFIRYADGAVHWWIGDWLNYGEQNYGEMYEQALEQRTA